MSDSHQWEYEAPNSYQNLTEVPSPNTDEGISRSLARQDDVLGNSSTTRRQRVSSDLANNSAPQSWANLDEVAAIPPVENPNTSPIYHHTSLEEVRGHEAEYESEQQRQAILEREEETRSSGASLGSKKTSKFATQLYTHSHLIFFAILGTLARKGLAALTTYPGTPINFDTVWVNFAGCLVMGFLVEDRMLFLYEWGSPTYHGKIMEMRQRQKDEESGTSSDQDPVDLEAAKTAFMSTKKSIPLYIGLTTGFCGSFTTFSEFILDVFLALSNNLPAPGAENISRNGGYSFMALVGVVVATVCLSVSGLMIGAHMAISLESSLPSLPYSFTRKFLDRLMVILGWGSWLGAVLLCVFPPYDFWRGRVTFALVFAPLGVLARFYLALFLNAKQPSFPLGTFAANVVASAVLASAWDMSHADVGGVIGCQVLQGIEEGFCGCLSTVSTWVVELTSLNRKHSYLYGSVSVLVSFVVVVLIAGSETWSIGTKALQCST